MLIQGCIIIYGAIKLFGNPGFLSKSAHIKTVSLSLTNSVEVASESLYIDLADVTTLTLLLSYYVMY